MFLGSAAQDDEIDGLVDMKGGPENIYEFAAEADIVVPCLTLNSETVSLICLFVYFIHNSFSVFTCIDY